MLQVVQRHSLALQKVERPLLLLHALPDVWLPSQPAEVHRVSGEFFARLRLVGKRDERPPQLSYALGAPFFPPQGLERVHVVYVRLPGEAVWRLPWNVVREVDLDPLVELGNDLGQIVKNSPRRLFNRFRVELRLRSPPASGLF